jgi:hypothetical protein
MMMTVNIAGNLWCFMCPPHRDFLIDREDGLLHKKREELNLGRRTGGGGNIKDLILMLRFKGVQNLEQKELGQMKKMNLVCGQGGVLKLTGRAGIVGLDCVF